jgi:hypothetical protein
MNENSGIYMPNNTSQNININVNINEYSMYSDVLKNIDRQLEESRRMFPDSYK